MGCKTWLGNMKNNMAGAEQKNFDAAEQAHQAEGVRTLA